MARVQDGVPWTSGTDDQTTELDARNDAAEAEAGGLGQEDIDAAVAALVASAPAALNTLDELAAALGDDANYAATITTALAGKVPTARTVAGLDLSSDRTAAALAAALGAEVFKQAQAVNAQTGTSYTLVAGDAGKLVTLSNAGAITLTVPQDSDATIAVGTYIDLLQLGAGQVTVAAGTGATLRTSGLTAKARAQYSRLGVQKISANTWSLFGDLAAS
jgi:hypothetical protein